MDVFWDGSRGETLFEVEEKLGRLDGKVRGAAEDQFDALAPERIFNADTGGDSFRTAFPGSGFDGIRMDQFAAAEKDAVGALEDMKGAGLVPAADVGCDECRALVAGWFTEVAFEKCRALNEDAAFLVEQYGGVRQRLTDAVVAREEGGWIEDSDHGGGFSGSIARSEADVFSASRFEELPGTGRATHEDGSESP